MARRAQSLDELIAYFRGVYYATGALERRFRQRGSGLEEAVREVADYREMATRYLDALRETRNMHREEGAR
jgi:hypothetical protein